MNDLQVTTLNTKYHEAVLKQESLVHVDVCLDVYSPVTEQGITIA